MKRFKITDGLFKKIEHRLLQVVLKEYDIDGIYLCLDGIEIVAWENNDYSIELTVRWGRMVDGKETMCHQAKIYMVDGNLDFLAGQFYEAIVAADGNKN